MAVAAGTTELASEVAEATTGVKPTSEAEEIVVEELESEDVSASSSSTTSCSSFTASRVKYPGEYGAHEQLSFVPRQQNAPVPQARTPTAPTAVARQPVHLQHHQHHLHRHWTLRVVGERDRNLQSRQKSVQVSESQSERAHPPMS